MMRDRGFVLLNALVMVIAIASIATAVLTLAARATARLAEVQADAQLALYLDAAEALAVTILADDWAEGGIDHLGDDWAVGDWQVPIDRGSAGLRIVDLQGRININDLAAEQNRQDLVRLFDDLDVPSTLVQAITEFMKEGGPSDVGPYLSRPTPIQPTGGEMKLIDELRAVEGMTSDLFDRIAPYVSVLPPGTTVNANTAPAAVLGAMMPDLSDTEISELISLRDAAPFADGDDVRLRLATLLGVERAAEVPVAGLGVRTSWFEGLASAEVDGRRRQRRLILFRDDSQEGQTRVVYAIPVPGRIPFLQGN